MGNQHNYLKIITIGNFKKKFDIMLADGFFVANTYTIKLLYQFIEGNDL